MILTVPPDLDPKSFFEGVSQGIWLYAWSKDGEQQVGTSGRTLKQAQAEIKKIQQYWELAAEIRMFLNNYGRKNAEEPSEWSSPDALQMEMTATYLERGMIRVPNSSWHSGGYGDLDKGKECHDRIWRAITELKPL